jgi:biotin carboxyl carrier protein
MEEIKVNIDGEEHSVQVEELEDGKLRVMLEGSVFDIETKQDIKEEIIEEKSKKGEEEGVVVAPLPGTVASISKKVGDKVKKGTSILKLVAMKMENDIKSNKDGVIKEIKIKKNDTVNKGDILVIVD